MTLYILRKINQQYIKAVIITREPPASYIDYYKLNIGLPYSYIIREIYTRGEKLALEDIYLY